MALEDDKKHSLDLLIYEYLLKNHFDKTANALREELDLTDFKLSDHAPSLSVWYDAFIETAEVRSGQKFVPESLNRIEGIMLKLENDKQRYSRMKSSPQIRSSLTMRKPFDLRSQPTSSFDKCDLQHSNGHPNALQDGPMGYHSVQGMRSNMQSSIQMRHHMSPVTQPILSEIKRIDLGLSIVTASCFCSQNSTLIIHSSDGTIHFYNLTTNEIEYDFPILRGTLKMLKAREIDGVIYFAYSYNEYCINLCKYEYMKKDDIRVFEFEASIKEFCLGKEYLYVLDNSGVKAFTFSGTYVNASKHPEAFSVEWFGNNLVVAEGSKISEYDPNLSAEVGVIAMGVQSIFKVKGNVGFIISSDSIQAIDSTTGSVVASVKCTLPCKDLSILSNTIAVCTTTDLFYASDVIPLKNPIEIAQFICLNHRGLLAVSSDGIVTLFSKMQAYE